jgi:RNA polymerase sigma-70 factor (ECF subfamily)
MSKADEERFSSLYESTRSRIAAYALRRAASREEAADIVAETFEIAWRRLPDVPPSPDDLLCRLPVPRDHPVASIMGPPRAHLCRLTR